MDSVMNTTVFDQQVYYGVDLGNVLETKGRIVDAAKLFEDIGNYWTSLTNHFDASPTRIWQQAAIAWRKIGDYAQAERCYIRSLWADRHQYERWEIDNDGRHFSRINNNENDGSSLWNLNESVTRPVLSELVSLYDDCRTIRYLIKENFVDPDEVPNVDWYDDRMFGILDGLLYAAGVCQTNKQHSLGYIIGRDATFYVKNKFTATPHAANKALQKVLAAQSSSNDGPISAKEFYTRLFAFHNGKCVKHARNMILNPQQHVERLKDLYNSSDLKTMARKDVQASVSRTNVGRMFKCDNCEDTFLREDARYCPCLSVQFCGKDCRKSH